MGPLGRGAGVESVGAFKGGTIPGAFTPAVDKGVREALALGAVAGYPVVSVEITVPAEAVGDVTGGAITGCRGMVTGGTAASWMVARGQAPLAAASRHADDAGYGPRARGDIRHLGRLTPFNGAARCTRPPWRHEHRHPAHLPIAPAGRTGGRRCQPRDPRARPVERRYGAVTALAGRPHLLMLDEPTASLEAESRRSLWQAVRAPADEGSAVLLATHLLEAAEALSGVVSAEDGAEIEVTGIRLEDAVIDLLNKQATVSTLALP